MTGDQNDIFARLKSAIPARWFGSASTVIDAILWGAANGFAFVYAMIAYAKLQTRVLTATDGWLDLIAADFFGTRIFRGSNESDASFRRRILVAMFRERGTRKAMVSVLTQLTGSAPTIVEPWNPGDVGAYSIIGGYGVAGAYGSTSTPYQAFITVFRPTNIGPGSVGGYGSSVGGYGTASQLEYIASSNLYALQNADIYSAIESVKPTGTLIWVAIK